MKEGLVERTVYHRLAIREETRVFVSIVLHEVSETIQANISLRFVDQLLDRSSLDTESNLLLQG